jgi:hypothetical protein
MHIEVGDGHTQYIQFGLTSIQNRIGVTAYDNVVIEADAQNANANSTVKLNVDGSTKLTASSTGIDVTGSVSADGGDIQVDSFSRKIGFKLSGNSNAGYLIPYDASGNTQLVNERSSGNLIFKTANTEAMRLDSSGKLLVGKTASGGNTAGFEVRSDGDTLIARDGNRALFLNRKTSDGNILDFAKDGTTVGKIGAYYSGLYIGTTQGSDSFLFFESNIIRPASSTGANRDAAIDLGRTTSRFKDFYLSGTANTGGLDVDGTIKLDGNYPTGTGNVALGDQALDSVASGGNYNVAIGSATLTGITTGGYNVGIGGLVAPNATTANYNVGIGMQALDALTTGYRTTMWRLVLVLYKMQLLIATLP